MSFIHHTPTHCEACDAERRLEPVLQVGYGLDADTIWLCWLCKVGIQKMRQADGTAKWVGSFSRKRRGHTDSQHVR